MISDGINKIRVRCKLPLWKHGKRQHFSDGARQRGEAPLRKRAESVAADEGALPFANHHFVVVRSAADHVESSQVDEQKTLGVQILGQAETMVNLTFGEAALQLRLDAAIQVLDLLLDAFSQAKYQCTSVGCITVTTVAVMILVVIMIIDRSLDEDLVLNLVNPPKQRLDGGF